MPPSIRPARGTTAAFALCLAFLAPACTPETADEPPPAAADLIPGTPAGGLEDWIAEIREGTTGIEIAAAEDATAAQRKALDLYVGRQEYLELYYGTNGRLTSGVEMELGEAVMENERRFHEMLQLLAVSPVDTAALRAKRDELHAQMDEVLELAKNVSVPLTPPGNSSAAREQES